MAKRTTVMLSCDNPDCDTETEYDKAELPLGFYFERGHQHHGGWGGPIPKTYACKTECIVPAIQARTEEEW